jgi:hypothetical protein
LLKKKLQHLILQEKHKFERLIILQDDTFYSVSCRLLCACQASE